MDGMTKKRCLVWAVMVLMAAPLMGNQGCDEKKDPATRVLKKKVDLGDIKAREFTLPGGTVFDVGPLVNAQLKDLLAINPDFLVASVGISPLQAVPVPACIQERSQFRLSGTVNAFEFTTGVGVKIGYSPNGEFNGGTQVGANVKVDSSQMELSMLATDPLSGTLAGSGVSDSKETQTKIGANVDFNEFKINPEAFLKTPLATVTRKAIEGALKRLGEVTRAVEWEAQIVEDRDNFMVFNAGSRSRVQVGDKFVVHNLYHYWANQPCKSKYQGNIPTTDYPLAILEVVELGEDLSKAKVLVRQGYERVEVGARVRIQELVGVPKATP